MRKTRPVVISMRLPADSGTQTEQYSGNGRAVEDYVRHLGPWQQYKFLRGIRP